MLSDRKSLKKELTLSYKFVVQIRKSKYKVIDKVKKILAIFFVFSIKLRNKTETRANVEIFLKDKVRTDV